MHGAVGYVAVVIANASLVFGLQLQKLLILHEKHAVSALIFKEIHAWVPKTPKKHLVQVDREVNKETVA